MDAISFGAWSIECSRGFTPAELAEAASAVSKDLELRYVGGLGRAQAGFVHAAQEAAWVHLTLWDPNVTGLVLTIERDDGNAAAPFVVKVETEIARERFADDAARRAIAGELAKRIVDGVSPVLGWRALDFVADAGTP